jgi:hypothetical protein
VARHQEGRDTDMSAISHAAAHLPWQHVCLAASLMLGLHCTCPHVRVHPPLGCVVCVSILSTAACVLATACTCSPAVSPPSPPPHTHPPQVL